MPSKKIKIGIFADDMDRQAMGSTLVLRRLVENLLNIGQAEVKLIYKEGKCRHPLCDKTGRVPVKLFRLPKFSGFFSYLWFFIATKEKFNILHFPRPVLHPFFWLMKLLGKTKKIVATFHGAPESKNIPIYQTFFNHFNRWFIILFGQFFIDSVIADSRFAIEQIVNYYKIPERKIVSIYLGVDEKFKPLSTDEKKTAAAKLEKEYDIKSPYVLTVARLDPHKNVHRMARAFFAVKEKLKIPHHFIIVGGRHEPRYSDLVEEIIRRSKFKDSVYLAPFIKEEDLPPVYACADSFLYASLSEGFGLPIAEAMASGTPVITSGISCMPEVAGGAAVLVDPYSVDEIATALDKVLSDARLRQDLIKRGSARAREFSWQKMAVDYRNLYSSLLSN